MKVIRTGIKAGEDSRQACLETCAHAFTICKQNISNPQLSMLCDIERDSCIDTCTFTYGLS